jgi:hypothetical protein
MHAMIELLDLLIFMFQFIFVLTNNIAYLVTARTPLYLCDEVHDKIFDFQTQFLSDILNDGFLIFHEVHEFGLCLSEIFYLVS